MKSTVSVPQITSIDTAIRLYYQYTELRNAQIRELFGKIGNERLIRLKRAAVDLMIQEDCPVWNASAVNTMIAYKAWGLDIADLEQRHKKLKSLGFLEG